MSWCDGRALSLRVGGLFLVLLSMTFLGSCRSLAVRSSSTSSPDRRAYIVYPTVRAAVLGYGPGNDIFGDPVPDASTGKRVAKFLFFTLGCPFSLVFDTLLVPIDVFLWDLGFGER